MENQIEKTGHGQSREGEISLARVNKLFEEVNAIKIMTLGKAAKSEDDAELLKHCQAALKAIDMQLKILLGTSDPNEQERFPDKVDVIWQAMAREPHFSALLNKRSIREKLIANLRRLAGEENQGQ